jgi:Zn-dependent protease with chaperone function
MRSLVNWLRRYLRDSIVLRVCVFIYSALFVSMGLALAVAFTPPEPLEWLAVALGLAIAGFGAYMAYASVFGRLRILEKAANAVSYGGELLVIVLVLPVFIAAIPIAGVVKRIRSPRRLF